MIKYCLHPGFVVSKTDGDRHYIGAGQLANLYGVSIAESATVHEGEDAGHQSVEGVKCLYPSWEGNYPQEPR